MQLPPIHPARGRKPAIWAIAFVCLSGSLPVGRADEIVFNTSKGGSARTWQGEVLDWTGENLLLRQGDRQRRIPSENVVEVRTTWPAEKLAADAALEAGQWSQAIDGFRKAYRAEQRAWAKRQVLLQLLRAARANRQPQLAANACLAILAEDPTSPALAEVPLAWVPQADCDPAVARQWLAARGEVQRLLGASYLLSTQPTPCRQALGKLTSSRNPLIADLATAQLWRVEPPPPSLLPELLLRLPNAARAGPTYLAAKVEAAGGNSRKAALHLLRVVIDHGEDQELAPRALLDAARLLANEGDHAGAQRLALDLLREYPRAPERTAAEVFLPPSSSP